MGRRKKKEVEEERFTITPEGEQFVRRRIEKRAWDAALLLAFCVSVKEKDPQLDLEKAIQLAREAVARYDQIKAKREG